MDIHDIKSQISRNIEYLDGLKAPKQGDQNISLWSWRLPLKESLF
jgi:hypothetical protein